VFLYSTDGIGKNGGFRCIVGHCLRGNVNNIHVTLSNLVLLPWSSQLLPDVEVFLSSCRQMRDVRLTSTFVQCWFQIFCVRLNVVPLISFSLRSTYSFLPDNNHRRYCLRPHKQPFYTLKFVESLTAVTMNTKRSSPGHEMKRPRRCRRTPSNSVQSNDTTTDELSARFNTRIRQSLRCHGTDYLGGCEELVHYELTRPQIQHNVTARMTD
jgi:hypothetical protein